MTPHYKKIFQTRPQIRRTFRFGVGLSVRRVLSSESLTIREGFTLIEIILVVAIMTIILTISAPFLSRFYAQNTLEVSSNKVVSSLRKAQSYAMSNKDNSVWGVCKTGNNIRLFRGSCSTPDYFEDFDLSKVSVAGLTELSFTGSSGKRGEPSSSATITISNDIGTTSVGINNTGGIDIN